MGKLIFNGVSSEDLGVIVQTPPIYEFPSKRYDVIQIEGKNGDIVIDKNSYNNVEREYNLISIFRNNTDFISNVRNFVDWLNSVRGYARLEDSYEPEYYRLAMFRSGGQMPNLQNKATGMIVKFECKPQRYLKSGDEEIELSTVMNLTPGPLDGWQEIINPTNNIALPEFNIENTSAFTSGIILEIKSGDDFNNPNKVYRLEFVSTDNYVIKHMIDSELEDIYTEDGFINNFYKSNQGFPKLYPGKNWVRVLIYEQFTEVKMKPRWWVL